MWQQVELVSELESNVRYIDWGRKWLVNFSAGRTQLVLFDWSNNSGAVDVKMDGSEEKSSFMVLGLSFSSKWNGGSYILYC